jgi:DNA-binding response OmpR family regulator
VAHEPADRNASGSRVNGPLTDRQRCMVLEGRIAELEQELAAWRGNSRNADRDFDEMQRLVRLRDRLQRGERRAALVAAGMFVRLIDHPGVVVTKGQLIDASRHPGVRDHEPELRMADVQVNFLRSALRRLGLPVIIETVWGYGYRVSAECAQLAKASLEPPHD